MKRLMIALFVSALALASCSKDEIVTDSPSSTSPTGNSTPSGTDSTGSGIDVDSSGDFIENTTFDRTVTVVYASSGATVENAEGLDVSVSGAGVTITNPGDEVVKYILQGSASNGYFKLYSSRKQAIVLSSLSLANGSGAAINNQSKKRTFVVLEGESTLSDGTTYAENGDEDEKAAFFSEGQLVFSGEGTLTVKAKGKSGITSDDYVRFLDGPTVTVSSTAGHGVRGKDAVIVSGGNLDITVSATGKKGICSDTLVYFAGGVTAIHSSASAGTVDGELTGAAGIKADLRFVMEGGSLDITCTGSGCKGITGDNVGYFQGGEVRVVVTGSNYGSSSSGGMGGGRGPGGYPGGGGSSSSSSKSAKGIKFDGNLYFSGGTVYASASAHEGIEAKGIIEITGGVVHAYAKDDAINSGGDMTISDGFVCGHSYGNDGLDANGNMYVQGGVVYAVGTSSPEVGLDANTEGGYKLYVTGGTLVAVGGIEGGSSLSQAIVSTTSWAKKTNYALYDGDTLLFAFRTPQSGGSSLVLSHAGLKSGSSYQLKSAVSFSEGTPYFEGWYVDAPLVSGGSSSTSLTATLTSPSGGMGPGGRW